MFTGIVETVKPVKVITSIGSGLRLTIDLAHLATDAKPGDSICVNGVCLTISQLAGTQASFDVMAETARRTTLASFKVGQMVNLERALLAGGRFGGHIVQGHVDGVGTVNQIDKSQNEWNIWITSPPELINLMIDKGSITIEGVSLTIVKVEKTRFSVSLIPTTLAETNLKFLKPTGRVNLEVDIISKWINKRLDQFQAITNGKLTVEKLHQHGF